MLEKARRGQSERNLARSWAANTSDVVLDGQGRIPIPPHLRDYARLEGEVVINGVINHVELWNPDRWGEADAEGTQVLLSGQESLDDLGF